MRNLIRRHRILVGAVALAACLILWSVLLSVTASARGELAARYDISRGHYDVLGYGLPDPWRNEYARLLQERYGVKFRTIALCIVSRTLVAYADSYDTVSTTAINRKFGHDVFEECGQEARKNWEQAHRSAMSGS
jgi:hypothetical protein